MTKEKLITQIKDLSKGMSQKKLENSYFDAVMKLPIAEIRIIHESLLAEAESCCAVMYPDFDNIY